jgi:CYTH domain-containing protein
MEIPEIVITGGPCAGKTTAFSYLQSWLLDRGYRVFVIPEAATTLIQGGVPDIGRIAEKNFGLYLEFQRHILILQQWYREFYRTFAAKFPEPSVIFSDRGSMDGKAYFDDPSHFEALLSEESLSLKDVRDNYAAVMHLVTAAEGAEAFYTTVNNAARRENAEEARVLDRKTQAAWVGHPHLRIIDNSTDFEGKMKRLTSAIARILGIPVPLEIERKFLLRTVPDLGRIEGIQASVIEQMYLVSAPGEQLRIRKRTASDGSSTYYRTTKTATDASGVRLEHESRIRDTEYLSFKNLQEPGTHIIQKTRYCFIWESQYFELDVFKNPAGIVFLEIELTEENDRVVLPPFLDIVREVTDEKAFSNYGLAQAA